MLRIENLRASVDGKPKSCAGSTSEVDAGRGPRRHGAERFGQEHAGSYILAGRDGYEVTQRLGKLPGPRTCWRWSVDERANEGLFLAFQYPVEIPGVAGSATFLKDGGTTPGCAHRRPRRNTDAMAFLKLVRAKRPRRSAWATTCMKRRALNVGFSGGEKKRNEVLQMALLEPVLAMLDETDSGLDIDALKVVAAGINAMRAPERAMVVITHYQRLLDHVVPDKVHVLSGGRIVRSGGRELALELERSGYAGLGLEPSAAA